MGILLYIRTNSNLAMKIPITWIVLLATLCSFRLYADDNGKPFITNYTSKQYHGHTQNWVIEQDTNGIMYFGNQAGVLSFDGCNWRTLKISNHSTVRSLAKDKTGTIYVGAVGELGYLSADNQGKTIYISLMEKIDSSLRNFTNVWNISVFQGKIFFLTDNYLFEYDGKSFKHYTPKGEFFFSCFATPTQFFVHDYQYGLTVYQKDSLVLVTHGSYLKDEAIHAIMPIDTNQIMLATAEKGLMTYHLKSGTLSILNMNLRWYAKKNHLYHALQLSNGNYAIGTIQNGIAIVDKNGNFIEIINKASGLLDQTIYYMIETDGVLWCALEKGITKIEYSAAFRYWDESTGLQGSLTDMIRYKNKLLVATGSGLYILTSQNIDELSTFKKLNNFNTQTWDVEPFQQELLVGTGIGLQRYNGKKSDLIFRGKGVYKVLASAYQHNRIYIGLENKLAYVDFLPDKNKFSKPILIKNFNGELRDLIEDENGNLWGAINYMGIAKINYHENKDSNFYVTRVYKKNQGVIIDRQVRFFKLHNSIIFASDLQNLNYIAAKDTFVTDTILTKWLGFKPKTPMIFNAYGHKNWVNARYIVDKQDHKTIIDSTLLKRFPPFNIEQQFIENENKAWIGTSEGLIKITDTAIFTTPKTFKTIIRKVVTKNDSVLFWGADKPKHTTEIEHQTNFIGFHFSAPYFIKENDMQYRYFLEGYDQKWSDWTTENKKEFTNLFEGKYTFKVQAKNYLGQVSQTDQFSFTVLPPFYRTYLAYLIYASLIILLISLIVLLRTKKLRHDKIKLERIIQSRTQEVINQKNQIENVVKKLSEANKELEKLSVIAKKSDNAVAVFDHAGNLEWINEGFTRMYGYTLEQFIKERGKNIFEASDNTNISETIKKCFKTKETTIYQYYTITRNGKGIWAQTTLTPLLDKAGNLNKFIAIDTDITKLKDAELKIEHQRDELKTANENKDKLFSIIAHDLRGPLSNIFTILNIIYHDIDIFNKSELKNIISQLKETTGNTFNLTENLLDWAHLRRDTIPYNPTTLKPYDLVQETVELYQAQTNDKEITVENNISQNIKAYADEEMVKTILRNLIGNAIKFTNKTGKINITATIENVKCWIHITDTGKGMEDWEVNRLFQIDKHHTTLGTEKEKGSGLGLILAKEFAEKNKGEIKVKSKKDAGSTFSFSLPVDAL